MTPPPASGDRIARAAASASALIVVAFALIVALKLPDTASCPAGSRPVTMRGDGLRRTICQTDPKTSGGIFHPPVRPAIDRHVAPRLVAAVLAVIMGWVLLWRPRHRRPRRSDRSI